MSEIEALTLRAQVLSQSVDFWNLLMLWGLALAAVAAVFVVVATRVVVTRTGQLTDVQNLLSAAKDRQLKVDLEQKDAEIAAAQRVAAESNKAAGEANERAGLG
jgi:outer membrane murein-binding lipoprotein Lpp